MKQKIGLVLTGGGMRCGYSAGALLALHEVYGFDEPYALGAASGSAGNGFYYLSRQYTLARKVWTKLLIDPGFLKPNGGVNVDYLIDTIFRKKATLDTKAIDKTKTKFFIPVTNVQTGATEFITNRSFFDYYEVLRAAKALPIVYGKKVRLGLKRYIDGDMGENIEDLARKVLSTGVTTLITINCEPPARDTVSKLFLTAKALTSRRPLRMAMLRDLAVPPGLCPTRMSVRAYCISPSKPLKVRTMSGSNETLTEAFNLGYADVAGSRELQALFKHGTPRKQKG
ncbi:MAG: patatin-like phospholipase family protein [Patescibacteria group bacterium]